MMYYAGTEAHEHLLVVNVEDPSPDQEETQQPLTKFGIRDLRKESDVGDPISNGMSVEIPMGVIVGIIGRRWEWEIDDAESSEQAVGATFGDSVFGQSGYL